jgi:hypothetical protein
MKKLFLTLLLATLCVTGYGQTIKSLGYNTTNGEVVYTGTNGLNFATEVFFGGDISITSAELKFSGTERINLEEARFAGSWDFDQPATWRTNLGLGASDEVTFGTINSESSIRVVSGTNVFVSLADDVNEFFTPIQIFNSNGLSFEGTNAATAAAATRNNLGVPSSFGSGSNSVVAGGLSNIASGNFSFASGGFSNSAISNNTWVGGSYTRAIHEGSFVWGDNNPELEEDFSGPLITNFPIQFDSITTNSFNVRASGGMYFSLGTNGISFANTTSAEVTRSNLGLDSLKTVINQAGITNPLNLTDLRAYEYVIFTENDVSLPSTDVAKSGDSATIIFERNTNTTNAFFVFGGTNTNSIYTFESNVTNDIATFFYTTNWVVNPPYNLVSTNIPTRTDLGFSTNLDSLWTATNQSSARSAIGVDLSLSPVFILRTNNTARTNTTTEPDEVLQYAFPSAGKYFVTLGHLMDVQTNSGLKAKMFATNATLYGTWSFSASELTNDYNYSLGTISGIRMFHQWFIVDAAADASISFGWGQVSGTNETSILNGSFMKIEKFEP